MSLSDWNDKKNGANMVLSTAQVHEGEKALEVKCITGDELIKILNMSEAANPKSVVFDFWAYLTRKSGTSTIRRNSNLSFFMRYQDVDNYYFFTLTGCGAYDVIFTKLGVRKAGVFTWSAQSAGIGNVYTWYHFKLEICEIGNVLYAYIYREEASEWVLKAEMNLSPAEFTSGGAVGVGAVPFGYQCDPFYKAYLDYTKVYY